MPSYKYRTYKFRYTTDLGQETIKRQRAYLDAAEAPLTPITPLFEARIVDFSEKVSGTSVGLRYCLTYIDLSSFKANIPYAPGDINLTQHLREILAAERVICGDYIGETQITGGSANAYQPDF